MLRPLIVFTLIFKISASIYDEFSRLRRVKLFPDPIHVKLVTVDDSYYNRYVPLQSKKTAFISGLNWELL